MIFNLHNPYERDHFKEYVNAIYDESVHPDKVVLVEVKKKFKRRSLSQNAYLHVLLGYFSSEFGYTLEEVKHDIFKKEVNPGVFMGTRVNKRGDEVRYVRSCSELDRKEMTDAIERFRNYSSAVAGLYLPAPHEEEMLIHAQQQIERFRDYV